MWIDMMQAIAQHDLEIYLFCLCHNLMVYCAGRSKNEDAEKRRRAGTGGRSQSLQPLNKIRLSAVQYLEKNFQ